VVPKPNLNTKVPKKMPKKDDDDDFGLEENEG
jgi:hypothetical protein